MKHFFLSGKSIIFIAPKTFGYEEEIIREMEGLGAKVTFHGQLPSDHPWIKSVFRLFPKFAWRYSDRYFISWLKDHAPETCDIIFVIKGEGLSPNFLAHLRNRYPNSRMVLHLWDSLVNCKHILVKIPFFDSISSFDPNDCKNMPELRYRPLFFLDKYLNREHKNTGTGVFFIGTLNGDRPKVIAKLLKSMESDSDFKFWLFVRSKLELSIRKIVDRSLKKIDGSNFIYKPMSVESISKYYNECAAVLDIEHSNQTGLTMRTFEVIASGKKLITTNKNIFVHDFYDPARICMIDRNNPFIPEHFLHLQTTMLPDKFIDHYSLHGWLRDILGNSGIGL